MQQEKLQDVIEAIKKQNLSSAKMIRFLKLIVKALSEYSTTSQTLPPQTLIPCCLFILPKKFEILCFLQEGELLSEQPEKMSVKLILQLYLKSMLKLMNDSSEEIKHVVIQGMNRSILLTAPFPKISKRWLKDLITIWSQSWENIHLSLRAFAAVQKYLHKCDEETYMWSLRRIYVAYFENCKQISWRNMEHINFMINCFCQFAKINDSRAYYVMFGYIRSIALQVQKLNKLTKKEKIQQINKLFSNQTLNCFKLLSQLISRVQSQQLSALIYPLVELMSAYQKISESIEFVPLKLHILDYNLSIMESTGVYIPQTADMIKKIANSSIFQKKISKKTQIQGDIELGYRLSKTELTNTNLVNELFNKLIFNVYKFEFVVSKFIGGPEIILRLVKYLKTLELSFSGYKDLIKQVSKAFKDDSQKLYDFRAARTLSLQNEKGIRKCQTLIPKKLKLQGLLKYESLKEEKEQLLKQKLIAENEPEDQDIEAQQIVEDEDEVNSGWSQAESGASDFIDEDKAVNSDESQQLEDIDYEGDPQDPDEAARQWSQEEWDSQNQLQNQ